MSQTAYQPDADRYGRMVYRRCGRSGVELPAIALGLWHNFGGVDVFETGRAVIRRAFDRGVTHFDLANNYGPPPGSAEEMFGRVLAADLAPFRDELIISTKAGYDMWPGPYGSFGSRKSLLASLDQSLRRMRLDYVDIFYSHRPDPRTPLDETMGALDTAVRQGKALYAGLSNYDPPTTRAAAAILRERGTPLLIHQPRYSMLDRTIEGGLLDVLEDAGAGCIVFSPLAQGVLTGKYLDDTPADARAARVGLRADLTSETTARRVRALAEIARKRGAGLGGEGLARMALAWTLRDRRVTTALIGARTVAQLDDSLSALDHLDFTDDELAAIDAALSD